MIKVEEYRKIMKDNVSSDEKIIERIQFLTGFCENIIDAELKKYLDECQNK